MKILITGVNGFVGSNIAVDLQRKHEVYGLDVDKSNIQGLTESYTWEHINNIPSIDIVIHLAGIAHDTKNTNDSRIYFEVNSGLTQKIFKWFLSIKSKKFIFFSSVKAVADKVEGEFLTEDTIPKPMTAYGQSKLEAEDYIWKLFNEFERSSSDTDKKVYIMRPCMIHGPGNKGNLNLLYKIVARGIPWPLGAFENQRSFISIANLQFVIDQLIEQNLTSDTFQIADDESISSNSIVRMIAESQGRKIKIWKINTKFIRLISYLGDLLHLPLNRERLDKLTESYVVSNKKLKRALKIDSMPLSADEGMKRTLMDFEYKN